MSLKCSPQIHVKPRALSTRSNPHNPNTKNRLSVLQVIMTRWRTMNLCQIGENSASARFPAGTGSQIAFTKALKR